MISLTGAALFLIQLLVVCQVFAEILPQILPFDQRNISVPRGDSITLTCNISMANVTQINWTKGRSVFAHSVLRNQTFSNFTSHYVIDVNLPSKLNISNVQHDDAGLYRCNLTAIKGQRTIEWNLTVSEKPEDILPFDQKNISVSRGDSITLTCNMSMANVTQINWTKGRSVFAHSVLRNQTFSNFTSHYVIDVNLPSKLNISNVQHDDAGLYRCNLTAIKGQRTIEWNLTVSEKPEDILPFDQKNISVSRGDSITLTCNMSMANVTQINWTKGRSVFAHSVLLNQTFSNFTSHYIIDVNLPSKLNISNVQHDDAGLYRCDITDSKAQRTIEWNLTVSEKPEGQNSLPGYFPYILTAVIGLLLCVFTSAVCLYRKLRARTSDQSPAQEQFHLQSETEVALRHPRGGTDSRANKRRSQYMERLNSIYNF